MDELPIPPLIPILIGINKYKNYAHLNTAATDADNLKKFFKQEFQVPEDKMTVIKDEEATRVKIINTLYSLQEPWERNNAIIFFFSGHGRRLKSTGIICPTDFGKETPGISDQTLVQHFESISNTRGDNITVFLDSPSTSFTWGNPSSFVVVAPRRSTEAKEGGAFTNSLMKVLRSEKNSIELLTVQTLADKMLADMGVEVDCYGQNVNRLLFNPKQGKAHYAFISGNIDAEGNIWLLAGYAHNIQEGTTYRIYPSNVVNSKNICLGYLHVVSIKDATHAKLITPAFPLPPIFYALEAICPHKPVEILKADNIRISSSPSWKVAEKPHDVNITLEITDDKVGFSWNGFAGDGEGWIGTGSSAPLYVPMNDENLITSAIRSAARFKHHVEPTHDSPISSGLLVQMPEVDALTGKVIGKDILRQRFVELKLTKGGQRRAFGLFLHNKNDFPVWPFVFICDPSCFSIHPWYLPEEALGKDNKLTIGYDDDSLMMFEWNESWKADVVYIKIFVTKDHTRFSFLEQEYDYLPGDVQGNTGLSGGGISSKEIQAPFSDAGNDVGENFIRGVEPGKGTNWGAMRITVKRTYEVEENRSGRKSWRTPWRRVV